MPDPNPGETYELTGTLCWCEIIAVDVTHWQTNEVLVIFKWIQHPIDPSIAGTFVAMSKRIFTDTVDVEGDLLPMHRPVT